MVYELLMKHRIEEIPLLDDDGRLRSLVSRSDYFEKIPLSNPELNGTEVEHISDALASNWIAPVGPYITMFEERKLPRSWKPMQKKLWQLPPGVISLYI